MGDMQPQLAIFRSSLELILSGDPAGLFNAANDLQQISKSEAIEILYLLAIEHREEEALLNYGYFLCERGRPDEGIVYFEKAYASGDPKAAFALGQEQLEMGNPLEAIKWLRIAGEHPYVPLRLAIAYRAVGDEMSAVEVLRAGSEQSAEAAVELIQTTDQLDTDSSIRLLEKHLENGDVDVLLPLADLYSKVGRHADGIELLRRSVAAGEPHALHNLGVALWEDGQTSEGKATLKKAAQKGDRLAVEKLHQIRRNKP
ncbi:tetratricopeptide repeat protein [Arthrobacter sp. CAN_C5]|uniref:tetratricopeptide repeat protein n=1 Tax=Arthrobacter sp. CAN_C5 TaxID=2760706 RepID=UPI001AE773D6|nr:hypothetical protein [Arthrobacter sp. CAN_C5]MBP2215160.1 Tfp pilus assembly protein PilF [Arthrobacter sp. CAN_C5]